MKSTGYYLEVPSKTNNVIRLKINYPDNNPVVNISSLNGITITFWVKFMGTTFESTSECPFLVKFNADTNSNFCIDSTTSILLKHDNNVVITESSFKSYVGKWVFIGISNFYITENDMEKRFSNMVNVYMFNKELANNPNYSVPPPGIKIERLDLGNEIVALFADFRFYKRFLHQPYGLIMDSNIKFQVDLVLQLLLYSTKIDSCLKNENLEESSISLLKIICQAEYNQYLDKANQCLNSKKYFDVDSFDNNLDHCLDCDEVCVNGNYYCGRDSKFGCTCNNFEERKNWFRIDKDTKLTYCEKQPYVDVSSYSKIQSDKISLAISNEYTLEFWFYIYSYNQVEKGFGSHEIIWDLHTKARIFNDNNVLKMECHPNYDNSNANSSTSRVKVTDHTGFDFYKWNVVYCSASLKENKYFINNQSEIKNPENFVQIDSYQDKQFTSLIIQPTAGSKINYGFMYIREIKLWSIYDKKDSFECFYYKPEKFPSLLNYFSFDTNEKIFYDQVSKTGGVFVENEEFVGYNIIDKENKYLDSIKFILTGCPYLTIIPNSGYYMSTNFLLQCAGDLKDSTKVVYNFGYSISDASLAVDGSINYIKKSSSISEMIYSFGTPEFNKDSINIDIFCEIFLNDNPKPIISNSRLKLFRNIIQKEFDYSEIVTGLDLLSRDMTEEELLNRAILLGSLAMNFYPSTTYVNSTSVIFSKEKNAYVINDPYCYSNFCNERGICNIIDKYLTCECTNDYHGNNCQLSSKNAEFLEDQLLLSWRSLTNDNKYSSLDGIFSDTKFLTASWIIAGASKFITSESFYNHYWNLIFYFNERNEDSLIKNIDLMFETMNNLLINYLNTANKFKLNNAASPNFENRNLNLTVTQKETLINSFTYLKNTIEGLTNKFLNNEKYRTNKIWKFFGFNIYIQQIGNLDFDFNNFFKKNIDEYEGYFDATKCLEHISSTISEEKFWFTFIDYKVNPFLFNEIYYTNTFSNLYTIYITKYTGEKVKVENCPEPIMIYFPIETYNRTIIEYINAYKYLYYQNSTIDYLDDYITSPKYVEDNGTVVDMTQLSRVRKFHRNFNLSCSFFDDAVSKFSGEGVVYYNLTNYFIQCNTNHLTSFLTYIRENPVNYYLDGPFFYLKYPQVFLCSCNYFQNLCFFVICGVIGTFILLLILFTIIDTPKFKKEKLLEYLKFNILLHKRRYAPKGLVFQELLRINRFSPSNIDINDLSFDSFEKKIRNEEEKLENEERYENGDSARESYSSSNFSEPIQTDNPKIMKLNDNNNNKKKLKGGFFNEMDIDLPALEDELDREVQPKLNKPVLVNNLVRVERRGNYEIVPEIPNPKINSLPSYVNEFNEEEKEGIKYPEISACEFFCQNIRHRHILLSIFVSRNIYHPRYRKIIMLFCFISIIMLLNTLIFSSSRYFDLKELTTSPVPLQEYFYNGAIVSAISNIIILIFVPLYRIKTKSKEEIFEVAQSGQHLKLLYDWEVLNSSKRTGSIIGIIINIIEILICVYFTIAYCAIIKSMQYNLMIGLGVAIGIDMIVYEILIEFLCYLFYAWNKVGCFK